jgi:hypothetical protein
MVALLTHAPLFDGGVGALLQQADHVGLVVATLAKCLLQVVHCLGLRQHADHHVEQVLRVDSVLVVMMYFRLWIVTLLRGHAVSRVRPVRHACA